MVLSDRELGVNCPEYLNLRLFIYNDFERFLTDYNSVLQATPSHHVRRSPIPPSDRISSCLPDAICLAKFASKISSPPIILLRFEQNSRQLFDTLRLSS